MWEWEGAQLPLGQIGCVGSESALEPTGKNPEVVKREYL